MTMQVCADTLLKEDFEHVEDFFFRTVHLGTECWAFVILNRLEIGLRDAQEGSWHNAAAHLRMTGRMLEYLGQHVMMLCSMTLSDYLPLKVEIDGTSGAGSTQVCHEAPPLFLLPTPQRLTLYIIFAMLSADSVRAFECVCIRLVNPQGS